MRKGQRAAQARRELDRKFAAASLEPIVARPRSGWIRAVRGALGMSQEALAARLGVTRGAVNKLEHAETAGGVTLAKLAEVAAALDCTLVYALVPRTTLDATVRAQARRVAAASVGYAGRTMALEAQGVDDERQSEAEERFADDLIARGDLWRAPAGDAPR